MDLSDLRALQGLTVWLLLPECLKDIKARTAANFLLLHSDQTEVIGLYNQ